MRPQDVLVVVRNAREAGIAAAAAPGGALKPRVTVQVAGEPASVTPTLLKKIRRSSDPKRRRAPVLVWAAGREDADAWRNAGAYVLTGRVNARGAAKALEAAARNLGPWIETTHYVGPCRRRRQAWLRNPVRRLADSSLMQQPDIAAVDDNSFATRMRQLRCGSFSLHDADRDRRAQFLTDVQLTVRAADRTRRMHSASALESLARYLAARGAFGALDQEIIEDHLIVAEGPAVDAPERLPRLSRAVDRAIGLI